MKRFNSVSCALSAMLGCGAFGNSGLAQKPILPDVAPIRNTHIKIIVTGTSFHHSGGAVSAADGGWVCKRLNELGGADGNTFELVNGGEHNFALVYSLKDLGGEGASGSVELSGWGWGYITTQYSGEDWDRNSGLIVALTDKAYAFIHNGWHDVRSKGNTGPQNVPSGRTSRHTIQEYGLHVTLPEEWTWRTSGFTFGWGDRTVAEWQTSDRSLWGGVVHSTSTETLTAEQFADRWETHTRGHPRVSHCRRISERKNPIQKVRTDDPGMWTAILREFEETYDGNALHFLMLFVVHGQHRLSVQIGCSERNWASLNERISQIARSVVYKGPARK